MIRTAMAQNNDLSTWSVGEDRCMKPYSIKLFLSDGNFGSDSGWNLKCPLMAMSRHSERNASMPASDP